jgi:hypothetical protein
MSTRELGEISDEDLDVMHNKAVHLFNKELMGDRFVDVVLLQDAMADAWALGHNQGYDDAFAEQEGK